MIFSMTAFARKEIQGDWGSAVWEIRSVNHRYLELSFRLPDALSSCEPLLREQIKSRLQRGKVEISLRYQPAAGASMQLAINKSLVEQLIRARTEIASLIPPSSPMDATDLLRWPGVLQTQDNTTVDVTQFILPTFELALSELIQIRQREGAALQTILELRLAAMHNEVAKVKPYLPQIINAQREKLLLRLQESKTAFDPARLEQEMVLFAQKIDVAEELDRLETHLLEVQRILQQGGSIGRRLDFLLQELNREANTLGAKSVCPETSSASIELKILIEQLREQAQNIE